MFDIIFVPLDEDKNDDIYILWSDDSSFNKCDITLVTKDYECEIYDIITYDNILIEAAKLGYIREIKLLREWGVTYYNSAFINASLYSQIETIRTL